MNIELSHQRRYKQPSGTDTSPSLTVSVILVTYNGRRYFDAFFSSVLAEFWPGCELIVVDNASNDGGVEFIQGNFPEIHLTRNKCNRGFAAACNQGAALARGSVLVFLNQDTCVAAGWLEPLVAELEQNDNIGLTTSKVLLMSDPEKIHLCGQDVHYTGLVFSRGFFSSASDFNTSQVVGAVSGASFAVKRELWDTLGGFDEKFFMYYEETDLCWRAQLAGYRCLFVPESVVYHDYRSGAASVSRLYYSMRNRVLMLLKNWGYGTLFLLAPALLLAEALEFAIALRHGWVGLRAKLCAYLWIAKNLIPVLRQREQAQSLRSISDSEILRLRTFRLTPVETPSSTLLDAVLVPLNTLFRLHHRGVVYFCKMLGL